MMGSLDRDSLWRPLVLCTLLAGALLAVPARAAPADPLAEVQDLYKAGRAADAMRRLDALIAQRPGDPRFRFQKGVMLVDQKRPSEAISVFQKLVQDHPALPEPLNNLAVLYAEQGQMEKARTTLESAIRSKPNYGTAFQNLGDLYTRMAGRAYARALQIDDAETAPKLALIRNLYDMPDMASADTVLVASAASAAAPSPKPPGTSPAAAASRPAPAPATATAAAPTTPTTTPPTPPNTAPNSAPPAPAPAPTPPPPAVAAKPTAPPVASAAKPAPPPPAVPPQADEVREVSAALKTWATAWSRRDIGDYVAAYVPGFKGGERSADEWQTARRQRILGKAHINVEVSNVRVNLAPDGAAKVTFRQLYVADALKVSSTKTVEMVKQRGRWLIRKELVGAA